MNQSEVNCLTFQKVSARLTVRHVVSSPCLYSLHSPLLSDSPLDIPPYPEGCGKPRCNANSTRGCPPSSLFRLPFFDKGINAAQVISRLWLIDILHRGPKMQLLLPVAAQGYRTNKWRCFHGQRNAESSLRFVMMAT